MLIMHHKIILITSLTSRPGEGCEMHAEAKPQTLVTESSYNTYSYVIFSLHHYTRPLNND